MNEKDPTAIPEMVPAFGVPNVYQEGHIKSDLYGDTIRRADALPAMPGTESIADGASRSLALHGKETGVDSSEGVSRSVELTGLNLDIGRIDSAGPTSVDAAITDKFVFAQTDSTNPNSPTKKVRVTEITIKPGEGSLKRPEDHAPFLPLDGRKKGELSRDKLTRGEEPKYYSPAEQASEIRVTLLDGKPSNVSWIVPDSSRNGPNGPEAVSGRTSIDMTLMPELRANRDKNYGNGEATRVENILDATASMFESLEAADNAERDNRQQAAKDLAQVALNSQARIDSQQIPF